MNPVRTVGPSSKHLLGFIQSLGVGGWCHHFPVYPMFRVRKPLANNENKMGSNGRQRTWRGDKAGDKEAGDPLGDKGERERTGRQKVEHNMGDKVGGKVEEVIDKGWGTTVHSRIVNRLFAAKDLWIHD